MFEGISHFMPFWYHFTNVNEEETQHILPAICMITKWMCFILAKKQCLYQLFWPVFFSQYLVFLTSIYFIYHNAGHSWGFEFSAADDESSFGIFWIKFSKDGRELVVGNSNESICIYDLGANKVTERIHAHVVWKSNALFLLLLP